jgi:phosphoribosylamine-glycine ligase
MKTYRVEIVETKTGKVFAVIGNGLTKEKAQRRIETGLTRIDRDRFFVRDVEE